MAARRAKTLNSAQNPKKMAAAVKRQRRSYFVPALVGLGEAVLGPETRAAVFLALQGHKRQSSGPRRA